MVGRSAQITVCVALLWIFVTVFASSGFAQSANPADGTSGTTAGDDLRSEVDALKTESAVVQEMLRNLEEQQRLLLERIDRLQRGVGDAAVADIPPLGDPAPVPVATAGLTSAPQPQPPLEPPDNKERYRDGIVIWETADDAKVPFLLRLNNNTQVRYLNTVSSKETYTDHLGTVREVHERNDITVNRSMFILAGYVFDPKLQYSLTVWTSAGASSIVVAGNIGWRFNQALTLTGGYTGVPGSRSLVTTFPFFQATDRSMADNFFRPAFTQGAWLNGEPVKGLNYLAFVGNGLNTLNISATKIDTHLLVAGSVWWEPLGAYSEPGKSRQMYDDYFASKNVRVRLGTSLTRSREDRFSATDQSTPDNTSIYTSDGVLAFATGAFAPGVTVNLATYKMWAIDGGLKKSGFSVNGQYYFRFVNEFEADGPLPLSSMFDHGFEVSAGHFVIPRTLMPYVRGSKVFGEFTDPYEYAVGAKWYFLPTERLWLTAELMRVHKSPYGAGFTPYTAGMDGWMPMVQAMLAF